MEEEYDNLIDFYLEICNTVKENPGSTVVSKDNPFRLIIGYDVTSESGEVIKSHQIGISKWKKLLVNTDEKFKEKLRTYISTQDGKAELAKIISNGDFEKKFC
jgi:hypothetical protein